MVKSESFKRGGREGKTNGGEGEERKEELERREGMGAGHVGQALLEAFLLLSSSSLYQLHKPVTADALTLAPEEAMQRCKEAETGLFRKCNSPSVPKQPKGEHT